MRVRNKNNDFISYGKKVKKQVECGTRSFAGVHMIPIVVDTRKNANSIIYINPDDRKQIVEAIN